MHDSLADRNATDEIRTSAVLQVEDICMCLHAILERVGTPLHLQSLHFVWQSFSQALATLENELCPGCAPSVPHALDLPEVPLKLTTLAEPAWTHYRILLVPSYNGLHRFRAWVSAFYDVNLHREIIDAIDDSMLLIETIADICGVRIEHPILIGQNGLVHSTPDPVHS
jgi:hypothetical protein